MIKLHTQKKRGFTLIELAIVLSVVGLMTVGIWRLVSSSNQQLKDTATARQQAQLIAAIKTFLAANPSYMASNGYCGFGNCPLGTQAHQIPLPSSAANAAGNPGCA